METDQPDPDIMAWLRPEILISAYAQGMFPMVQDGELMWFRPKRRGLMPLDERFHISRSLARTIARGRLVCTIDRSFDDVVRLCAERPDGLQTWISPEILLAYARLHELGLAHSIEAWPAEQAGRGEPVGEIARILHHAPLECGEAVAVLENQLEEPCDGRNAVHAAYGEAW